MAVFMEMATTLRHNRLIRTLSSEIIEFERRNEAYALSEEGTLVYWGNRKEPDFIKLVNIEEIEDVDRFKQITINDLYYVQSDFFMFKKNKYLYNERETRIAGQPDLIVEIWSEDNTEFGRKTKLDLYSSSPVTEHWYAEQDSNEVICYLGRDRLENQYLTDVLVTRDGLRFDLRYLAL